MAFKFNLRRYNLGEVLRVLIGHDNKGMGPGWKLGDVTVQVPPDPHCSPHYKPYVNASLIHTSRHGSDHMFNRRFLIASCDVAIIIYAALPGGPVCRGGCTRLEQKGGST